MQGEEQFGPTSRSPGDRPRARTRRIRERLVVVIPALDEEVGIARTIYDIKRSFAGTNFKILVVDGGSTDQTVSVASKAGATVIPQRQSGYGDALSTGFHYGYHYLRADILLTLDADGTYDAHDARTIVDRIEAGEVDYAIGRRRANQESMTLFRKYGNILISWATCRLLRLKGIKDTQSGLMAFRSYLIRQEDLLTTGWGINTEMLKLAKELGLRIGEYDTKYYARLGKSKLNPVLSGAVDIAIALRLMRDTEPLLMFGFGGGMMMAIGVGFGIVDLFIWSQTHLVSVAYTVLSALALMVGLQLVSLGLVAEMLKTRLRKRRYVSPKLFERHARIPRHLKS